MQNPEDQPPLSGDLPTGLPPISSLRAAIESILLIVDEPVSAEQIADAVGDDMDAVDDQLRTWQRELDSRGSGIDLREVDGRWRLFTRAEHAPAVEAFLIGGAHSTLSRAALETLAVIAYRQPVTRSQVAAVRGVNCDGVIRTLTLRGLIRELETDNPTAARSYETTALFLDVMGMESLDELPDLAPLLPSVESIDEMDY